MGIHDLVSPAEGVPYFIPKVPVTPGLATEEQPENRALPKLFQPLKIKNLTMPNRLGVSPMCMYSANPEFEPTPFHLVHYGSFALRGAGLIMIEATSVSKVGGLSPQDLAIYTDKQAKSLKEIVDFAHTQKSNIGIQLAHGGRKASGQATYVHLEHVAEEAEGGWPDEVVGPSALQFRPGGSYHVPKELSIEGIKQIVKDFGSAAKRAVEIAGFDFLEIHAAHGYLLNSFLSASSNQRTDKYGGSFENRTRILFEVIDEVRANVPKDYPVFLRISAAENTPTDPNQWTIDDSVKLAKLIAEKGDIDVIDISSGGNNHKQEKGLRDLIHAPLAEAVKKAVGDKLLVACVGKIRSAKMANELLDKGVCDIILVGGGYLKNPGLTLTWADDLGVTIDTARQYGWAFNPDRKQYIAAVAQAEENLKRLNL